MVWMTLAKGWKLKSNQTGPKAAFEMRAHQSMTLQKFFCQRSASQPKCGVTTRNIILI